HRATLSLHAALPICAQPRQPGPQLLALPRRRVPDVVLGQTEVLAESAIEDEHRIIVDGPDREFGITRSAELAHGADPQRQIQVEDRKSTRLNSSHRT